MDKDYDLSKMITRIENNLTKKLNRRITHKDIALWGNVDQSTVSKMLNPKDDKLPNPGYEFFRSLTNNINAELQQAGIKERINIAVMMGTNLPGEELFLPIVNTDIPELDFLIAAIEKCDLTITKIVNMLRALFPHKFTDKEGPNG